MKFGFVAKYRGAWPVLMMCEALDVSRSGFYAWLTRPRSQHSLDDEVLAEQARQSFLNSDRTYGARRVWRDVLEMGSRCGLHRMERVMRKAGLRARPRRRGLPVDRGARSSAAIAPNILDREFTSVAPNQKGVASMQGQMSAQWVTDALMMAIWRRGQPEAVMHHSDRGSQYTSDQFQRLLVELGVTCSMSRSGNCWDNSAMESFFKTLKTERTDRKVYRTRDNAKADVFDYIERFYNRIRRHSTINYISPVQFEQRMEIA